MKRDSHTRSIRIYGYTSTVLDSISGWYMWFELFNVGRLGDDVQPRPHYDDSVKDPLTGAKSEWTLLIYLTGVEDGVEGGEVGSSTVLLQSELR